ncbi:MAG: DUF58 domain-containing protein [Alphaproteobacteria bacterium]|jgi:uncharacterized protein (DUF58 family)|nr:DUF58 domain-containing protein [Alphaproteobacteria bacterium]
MSRTAPAPSLHQRAEALSGTLPPLLVAAERVAATVAQGVHGRRRVGTGESFWQFRRYQPGDAPARIDWRQSAKSQAVFVRDYEWEASQSVWLWRDATGSMDYRSRRDVPTKRERAELLLLALAALLSRAGERVSLLGGSGPPAGGRIDLARLALGLTRGGLGMDGGALPPAAPLPRHAELVLAGDFLSPLEDVDRAVRAFAARGVRGHLLQILDPAEQRLPFTGRVRFSGIEGEPDELVPRVEAIRDAYVARLARHCEGLAAIARTAGWSFATHRTDRPPQLALLTLYGALAGAPVAPPETGRRQEEPAP